MQINFVRQRQNVVSMHHCASAHRWPGRSARLADQDYADRTRIRWAALARHGG